jgi:hypothetical protein
MKSEPSVFIHRKDLPVGDWIYSSQPLDNGTANFTCENCRHPHIRYVHPLKHKKSGQMIKVGCVCAEHFLEDYSNPRLRENELKNYIGRRMRWPNLNWTLSQKGNLKLKKKGFIVVVRRAESGWWVASFTRDGEPEWTPVKSRFKTPQEAKLAAFDELFPQNKS